MKSVLVISFSNIDSDPRVFKQVSLLKSQYDLTVAGLKFSSPGVKFIQLGSTRTKYPKKFFLAFLLLFRFFEKAIWFNCNYLKAVDSLSQNKFDIIVANDFVALPIAAKIKGNATLIYDAHEYSPRESEDSLLWRVFFQKYVEYILKQYIQYVDHFMTVCEGISEEYLKFLGKKPHVLMNTPSFENLSVTPVGQKIKLVCHTAAIPSRKLEKLIEMAPLLDTRFELYMVLMPTDLKYVAKLKQLAIDMPNVKFLDPVPMKEISRFLNQFDIGVYLIEPSNFNNLFSLPNKFFEFIQARLAIAIGPSPEMKRIVELEKIGVVSNSFDPQDLAHSLNSLSVEQIEFMKKNVHSVASKYSTDSCWKPFNELVEMASQKNY